MPCLRARERTGKAGFPARFTNSPRPFFVHTDGDQSAFDRLRELSSNFRAGTVPPATYHAMLQSLGVGALTPSLAQLCPDLPLRQQLLAVYEVGLVYFISLSPPTLHGTSARGQRGCGEMDGRGRNACLFPVRSRARKEGTLGSIFD